MEDQFFSVLTRCRFQILVTNIGPNDLKLHVDIYKILYYKNLWLISINFLLFFCSGTSNLAKLSQGWHFFLVVYCMTVSRKCYISLT